MLAGLIADVHSNAVALRAVLAKLDAAGVEKILHAGDIVGYNPYPDETVGLFKKKNILSILGNHDRALITGDTSGFNLYAAAALRWTRNIMQPGNVEYIRGLENVEHIDLEGTPIALVHGSPRDLDEYIYPDDAEPGFLSLVNSSVLVLGHTHVQFKREYPEGMIVNPGSVGQPRDGDPRAAFAVLDTESGEVKLQRTGYDIEKVIEDMLAAHLPEELAFRLRIGF
ncbi:MAG: metallophosphoesterase family protein [Candidatus Methanoperedens sp.]|nr:metallophosphoesterase family protein [Candidatus Methanoperedens sp.]